MEFASFFKTTCCLLSLIFFLFLIEKLNSTVYLNCFWMPQNFYIFINNPTKMFWLFLPSCPLTQVYVTQDVSRLPVVGTTETKFRWYSCKWFSAMLTYPKSMQDGSIFDHMWFYLPDWCQLNICNEKHFVYWVYINIFRTNSYFINGQINWFTLA